jgi:DNA polymerase III epsilon subunit-like protein
VSTETVIGLGRPDPERICTSHIGSPLIIAATNFTEGSLTAFYHSPVLEELVVEASTTRWSLFVWGGAPEVQPDALHVNEIDLAWLQANGDAPATAVAKIEAFVRRNFDFSETNTRVGLAGHNISFDVSFLRRLYQQTGASFDASFSHRTIDTAGILRFLTLAGLLLLSGPGSTEAFEHFGIPIPGRHTALGNAIATAKLLDRLIELVRDGGLPATDAERPGSAG